MGVAMIDDMRRVFGRREGLVADVAGVVGLFALLIAGLHLAFPA
jgi:hypothetical protein